MRKVSAMFFLCLMLAGIVGSAQAASGNTGKASSTVARTADPPNLPPPPPPEP